MNNRNTNTDPVTRAPENPVRKIYLAGSMAEENRPYISSAADILRKRGFEVYVPMEHEIPNAWDYPNEEWGLMVFTEDVTAIEQADAVVVLNFGCKKNSTGSAWEAGFAYGRGIRIIVCDLIFHDDEHTSLMIENGRYATVEALTGLNDYDFETMPMTRTIHEQS